LRVSETIRPAVHDSDLGPALEHIDCLLDVVRLDQVVCVDWKDVRRASRPDGSVARRTCAGVLLSNKQKIGQVERRQHFQGLGVRRSIIDEDELARLRLSADRLHRLDEQCSRVVHRYDHCDGRT
jgi:hypothetical protein